MIDELKAQAAKELALSSVKLDPVFFAIALLASLAASLAASGLYRIFYERRGTGSQINRAFPLLGIAITTLFISVQVSLPLSLGLLGALSIIRFRTPIKEPEEVGFIMLVIAAAITCATFNFQFLIILYIVATVTLVVLKSKWGVRRAARDGIIIVSLSDKVAETHLKEIEECAVKHTRRCLLESSSSKDGNVSVQFSFAGLKVSGLELQTEMAKVADLSALNIFFNRPGGLT